MFLAAWRLVLVSPCYGYTFTCGVCSGEHMLWNMVTSASNQPLERTAGRSVQLL